MVIMDQEEAFGGFPGGSHPIPVDPHKEIHDRRTKTSSTLAGANPDFRETWFLRT
jgi:hypothetical protein